MIAPTSHQHARKVYKDQRPSAYLHPLAHLSNPLLPQTRPIPWQALCRVRTRESDRVLKKRSNLRYRLQRWVSCLLIQLSRLTLLTQSVDTASDQQNTAGADVISQPVGGLPAAMRVILALQRAQRHLRAIGVCPTKHAAQTEMMLEDGPSSDDEDECHQVIFCDEEDLGTKVTEEQKAKAAQNRRNKVRPADFSSVLSDR